MTSLIYATKTGSVPPPSQHQKGPGHPGVTPTAVEAGARQDLYKAAPSPHPQHLFVLVKHFSTNKSRLIIVLQKPHSEYLIELLLVISTSRR